jgi:hypothetical protein
MPDARRFQAVLIASGDQGWTVTVPEVGQASIDDAALADIEARQLIRQHLGLGLNEAEDLDLQLVDEQHRPIFVFDLLFSSYPGDQPAASDPTYRRLAENPPPGCRYATFGSVPGLRCIRRGTSRLAAIATLIAHLRQRYGLEADDLGFEKLWEWAGGREEREGLIAHLLLMAARRARWADVPPTELIRFLQTVTPEPPEQA